MVQFRKFSRRLLSVRPHQGKSWTRIALRFGERTWSYAEVAERTRKMVDLSQSGLSEERVYIILPDTPAFA